MSETFKVFAGAFVSYALVICAWFIATGWFGVSSYVIPSPGAVVASAKLGLIDGLLYEHIRATFSATLIGIGLGGLIGFSTAVLVGEVRVLERSVYPLVVGIQSVPKIAVAPLIIVYLGFGAAPKIFTVALLVFFPIFVNTVAGLKEADKDMIDLFRASSAKRLHILWNVKLPSAAHFVFNGLKVSVILGLIGCITSEFVASTKGLGFVIHSRSGDLDISMMFVCIILLAAFGVIGISLLALLERRLVFWDGTSQALGRR